MSTNDVLGIPLPMPKPALSYEDMWFQVKAYLASMVMDRKTPQAVFNVRELMGELERERIAPLANYIEERTIIDGTASRRAAVAGRIRIRGGRNRQRPATSLGEEVAGYQASSQEDKGQVSA